MTQTKRVVIAVLVGAALGLLTEFIFRPYIEKPLEKKVEALL